ncbi:MAG: Veg family protein [Peptococcaceae bacterium]|nr:Veg family protein [Peptococcaceae bacterium]
MTKLTIERVKKSLQPFVGCDIELNVNIGRNRVINHKGELEAVYRNVFVVKDVENADRRLSFNYVDLVTGNVVVALHKNGHIYRLANSVQA